jgi:AcrR family transcriptional regulator
MGIKERKHKQSEKLKRMILNAAEKLFVSKGYENVSMRKIAAMIDYSPTTIYRYFKNKEELLKSLTTDTHRKLSLRFEEIKSQGAAASPLEALMGLIREFILFGITKPHTFELYINLYKLEMGDKCMIEIIGGARFRIFHSWFELIERCIELGKFRSKDPVSVLLKIWYPAHGLIVNRIKHQNLPWKTDEEEIQMFFDLIFNGLLSNDTKIIEDK